MITVPEATKTIIERSRYLAEALSKQLINYSSLARYIKPELESMLGKKISNASVLMAIQRMSNEFKPKYSSDDIFKNQPSLIIHSNLFLLTYFGNNPIKFNKNIGDFMLITYGINETTLVANANLKKNINKAIDNKSIKKAINQLAAITIALPPHATESPSIYYFFLKSLAWEGINTIEIFTTTEELTFIVTEKDLKNTLGVIQSLFNKIE